jgi:two-component system nitrate/nitrite sensor histidine kinase NarX
MIEPDISEDGQLYENIFESAADGLIIADLKTGRVVRANPAACALQGCEGIEFVGMLPRKYIHPDSQHTFSSFLRAFRSGSAFDTHVLHVRCDGSTFPAEWHATAFPYQGRACLLGVLRDVSLRIRAEKKLHERVEARTREQTTLLEISHSLASTLELQPGLILEQLREIVEYTHAVLFGLSDSTLTALAVRGPENLEQAAPFLIRLEGPETLQVLFNGHRPIRIADVTSRDPEAVFLCALLNEKAALLLKDVRAWLWVPLAVKGRIIGGLGIAHAKRNYFTAHQAALALSMADQVAITMVNTELYENAQALAALQERQRLAQNLHDAVNQSLFSAGLIAEVLPRLWERDQAEARHSLEDLRRLTRGALAEMRELLAELRPSVLTDSSLGDLLRQLANAFSGRTNIPVSVKIAGEHVLPAEIQVALYRICQEALNNIAKHAGASQVEIDLQYESEARVDTGKTNLQAGAPEEIAVSSVEMLIRDDGAGFNTGNIAAPGHYGLGMMHERAEAVKAQLTVTSQPGGGTEVRLLWPGSPQKEAL